MIRWVVGLLIGIVSLIGISKSEAVTKVVGGQAECDTTNIGCNPIPLTVTILCTVGCTTLTAPSLTDSNRWWGTNTGVACRTSTNGGVTWGNCTSNADVAALYHYAGTADGGVLAAGVTNSGTHCKIYKSTDNAVSWVNVFDDAVQFNCGNGGPNGGTRLKCALNGKCELNFLGTGNIAQTVESTDNGNSWTRTALTGIVYNPISLVFDGSKGFSTPGGGDGGSNFKAFIYDGGPWSLSTVWPALVRCFPSTILNGSGASVCQTGITTTYTVRNSTGALISTQTLPNASPITNAGMVGMSPVGNALYLIMTDDNSVGGPRIGVWVTTNGLSDGTMVRIFTGPLNLSVNNQSDIHYINGCIYFSAGAGLPLFAKIC